MTSPKPACRYRGTQFQRQERRRTKRDNQYGRTKSVTHLDTIQLLVLAA